MTNEFGERFERLERNHVNDDGRVQNSSNQREFNVRRVVRLVNTNMDGFLVENTDIRDVDFEDMSVRHGESFGQYYHHHHFRAK